MSGKLEIRLEDTEKTMADIKYTGIFIECLIETKIGEELHVTSPMFVAPDAYNCLNYSILC